MSMEVKALEGLERNCSNAQARTHPVGVRWVEQKSLDGGILVNRCRRKGRGVVKGGTLWVLGTRIS